MKPRQEGEGGRAAGRRRAAAEEEEEDEEEDVWELKAAEGGSSSDSESFPGAEGAAGALGRGKGRLAEVGPVGQERPPGKVVVSRLGFAVPVPFSPPPTLGPLVGRGGRARWRGLSWGSRAGLRLELFESSPVQKLTGASFLSGRLPRVWKFSCIF